jgi:hypothetical protein
LGWKSYRLASGWSENATSTRPWECRPEYRARLIADGDLRTYDFF